MPPVPARHSILLRPACSLDACSDAAAAPAASSPHVFSFVVIRLPRINSQPRYRWMKEQERLNRSGRCQSLLLLLLLHSPPSSASSQLSTLRAVDCRTCACRVPASSRCDYAIIHPQRPGHNRVSCPQNRWTQMTNQTLTLPDLIRRQGSGGEPGRY